MKSTKKQQKITKFLAANTNCGYKIALLKHNGNQTYTFELKIKKKKKSRPTDPICFGHVTLNTTSFFFRLVDPINTDIIHMNLPATGCLH